MEIATGSTLSSIDANAFAGTTDKSKIKVTTLNDANKGLLEKAGISTGNITVQ
jgi:hypothetical protein